jgi:membrane-bound lytic murein transglycosylase D
MKKLLPALLLGLAGRSALAAAPPTVPAALNAMGLHLTLDDEARQLVQAKVNSLCRHQASLEARIALAEAAFPLIDQVLAEEGVPTDFRYLVLQESALQGDAESVHGAVGYWQFKRETALSLGLTVDGSIDERRHLTASTRAAARYLTRNNATLHNWANALLSYNLGLSGVRPYTEPSDADASQMSITANSSVYILDFIAQKVVFEPACAQHNVPFVPWREVPAAPGQSLAQQAAALSTDPVALARLNPWLLSSTVPQNGRTYTLLVPLPGAALLAANPKPIIPTPVRSAVAPTFVRINGLKALMAQPGDTPGTLAARGGASVGFFLKVNEMENRDPIVPGTPYFFQRKREAADEEYHVVRPGQTLAAIAQHFGVVRHALRVYNHLSSEEDIRPGLVLWLSHVRPHNIAAEYQSLPGSRPVAAQRAPTPPPAPAPTADDDAEELAAINALPTEVPGAPILTLPASRVAVAHVPASSPQPVDVKPVPVSVRPAPVRPTVWTAPPASSAWPAASGTYTVAAGETLYALARRAGVRPAELAAWNGLPPTVALRAGQTLRLSAPTQSATSMLDSRAYTVTTGDTFFSISRRYGCSVAELQARNGKDAPTLRVGEVLKVPIH